MARTCTTPNNNRFNAMSTFRPRQLLLATAVASIALPVVAEEHGFLEDASANLNLRNFFFNRNYTNPTKAQGGAQEWTQSFILDAKSGFTQGTVGFGVDVLGSSSMAVAERMAAASCR